MWDGFFTLLTLSALMALASFLAGSLPLAFKLSQRQLRLISALGTGVLVGTALIVIIPEGIDTLYTASVLRHVDKHVSAPAMRGGTSPPDSLLRITDIGKNNARGAEIGELDRIDLTSELLGLSELEERDGGLVARDVQDGFIALRKRRTPRKAKEQLSWRVADPCVYPKSLAKRASEDQKHDDQLDDDDRPPEQPSSSHSSHADEEESNPHAWVGISLIMGFILMYLIDTLPHLTTSPSAGRRGNYRPLHISLANLSQGLHHADSPSRNRSRSSSPDGVPADQPPPVRSGSSTTIGLIIHAVADGIALGASTATGSGNGELSFIIFLAIMVHKAPAAFGLTAVLLKEGLSKRLARGHLVVFSLAAPVGAFGTWALINILLGGKTGVDHGAWWTGVVLVFSGGTFLYVAMHSMQSTGSHSHDSHHTNGTLNGHAETGGDSHGRKDAGRVVGTLLMVVGMLAPLFTQIGHAHAH